MAWMLSPSVMASHASHWHVAMTSGEGIHAINKVLGSRLNQVHQVTTMEIETAEAKLTASLSYLVAMRR